MSRCAIRLPHTIMSLYNATHKCNMTFTNSRVEGNPFGGNVHAASFPLLLWLCIGFYDRFL